MGSRTFAALATATTWTIAFGTTATWTAATAAAAQPSAPTALASAPTASADDGKGAVTIGLSLGARAVAERSSAFAVDDRGAQAPDAVELGSRAVFDLHLDARNPGATLRAEGHATAEIAHGVFGGRPTLAGDRRPGDVWNPLLVTQAWLSARAGGDGADRRFVTIRAGLQLSQWGLGLLAHDGRVGLEDAASWFQLPYAGDRVLRAIVLAKPFTTGPLRGLLLSLAFDRVAADDILLPQQSPGIVAWHPDEVAQQGIFAARWMLSQSEYIGAYYVYRDQAHSDGKWLRVHSADLAWDIGLIGDTSGAPAATQGATEDAPAEVPTSLRLQGEVVGIVGDTNLAPTPEHPEHRVRQLGGVLRLRGASGVLRGMLDLGWFSGDASADDDVIGNFKADPNFQQGILLFRRIVGWQTARMRLTASNPDVVGVPNEDLERLASGGAVTSAITIFPRVGARLGAAEVYGGLLVALSPTPISDPFHSRTAGGGSARTVYRQAPDGLVLGSELDVGVRMRFALPSLPLAVLAGVEYGAVLPGGVMAGLDGPIHGGRVLVTLVGNRPQTAARAGASAPKEDRR